MTYDEAYKIYQKFVQAAGNFPDVFNISPLFPEHRQVYDIFQSSSFVEADKVKRRIESMLRIIQDNHGQLAEAADVLLSERDKKIKVKLGVPADAPIDSLTEEWKKFKAADEERQVAKIKARRESEDEYLMSRVKEAMDAGKFFCVHCKETLDHAGDSCNCDML